MVKKIDVPRDIDPVQDVSYLYGSSFHTLRMYNLFAFDFDELAGTQYTMLALKPGQDIDTADMRLLTDYCRFISNNPEEFKQIVLKNINQDLHRAQNDFRLSPEDRYKYVSKLSDLLDKVSMLPAEQAAICSNQFLKTVQVLLYMGMHPIHYMFRTTEIH